jgi:peptidoglycan/LPS O-acetylase OafA/YrhL
LTPTPPADAEARRDGNPPAPRGFVPPAGGWLALDGLRGVAILLVIAFHYLGTWAELTPGASGLFHLARGGWVGVDLFFALSGFLITGILIRSQGSPRWIRNFYARRTLRIFPLYYLCLALIFGLGALVPALRNEGFREIAEVQGWLWLYASNIKVAINQQWQTFGLFRGGWVELSHLWSLAVEEQFYLVWPALIALTPTRHRFRLALGAFAVALLLRLAFVHHGNVTAAYMLMPCRMDALASGAVIALLADRDGDCARLLRWARPIAVLAAAAIAGIWILRGDFWQRDPVVAGLGFSLVALLSGCLVVFAIALPRSHVFVRLLRARPLRRIGEVSYAMYILHFALLKILFLPLTPVDRLAPLLGSEAAVIVLRFTIVCVTTYALARLSWRYWERPFLALKRNFGAPDRSASVANPD